MIYTSLAVIALSASTAVSPLSKLVHLHMHTPQTDSRISLTLHNTTPYFQDVAINGRTYTINGHQGLVIKAPAGTKIYAASSMGQHHRGELISELGTELSEKEIDLK